MHSAQLMLLSGVHVDLFTSFALHHGCYRGLSDHAHHRFYSTVAIHVDPFDLLLNFIPR